jgi:flagellin
MIGILSGADQVLLNLDNTQSKLSSLTNKLSSGLRIVTAADDPSGNAIAQTLQTKALGLQQSVQNVQTGTNLLTVADGAAATIQDILIRVNSLIVESNSDINSNTQLENIQAEIQQSLLEINRIAGNATFNGLNLFSGAYDTYVAPKNANVSFVEVNSGLLPDGTLPTGDSVQNAQLNGSNKLIQAPTVGTIEDPSEPWVTGLLILQVTQSGNNLVDPALGVVPGPGVELNQILYSPDQVFANGHGNESEFYNILSANAGSNNGGGPNAPVLENTPAGVQSITFNLANIQTGDVGTAMGVEIVAPQQSGGGNALNINDGGEEGATISISLPNLSTNSLQISQISVLRPTQVDDNLNPGQVTGVDNSNQYAAMDAQFRVQQALQAVVAARAQIGSLVVATQEDANNDNIASLNTTSSQSSIQDLNVGTAVTQFTQTQILSSVGTNVLSSIQVNAKELTSLLLSGL